MAAKQGFLHLNISKTKILATLGVVAVLLLPLMPLSASADQYDDQIKALNAQIAQNQAAAAQKASEANTLKNKLAIITDQINAAQSALNLTTTQINQTNAQIDAENKDLDRQKGILKENLKIVYKQGDVSPIEVIASSKNLSDFVAQQEYLAAIKKKIDSNLIKIAQIKADLAVKKDSLTSLSTQQKDQVASIAAQQAQQQTLLTQTKGEEANYQNLVANQSAQVSNLRSAQAASFAKYSGSTSSNSGPLIFKNLAFGGACGGGYPSYTSGSHGPWGCGFGTDDGVDNWGLYNRECVSYAAWAMANRGGNMPGVGGRGNAYEWALGPEDGINPWGHRIDRDPTGGRVVAIADRSIVGGVGHAMVVENGGAQSNGYIHVSQYNWWPTDNGPYGLYSTMDVKPAGLWFIHF